MPTLPVLLSVSVTFYGRRADGSRIALDVEHPAHLNMASANARAFLLFLGIEPGDEPSGDVPLDEARRSIIMARATFGRRVDALVRRGRDIKKPGQLRVIEGAIDDDYLERRLAERFLTVVGEMGATAISWGGAPVSDFRVTIISGRGGGQIGFPPRCARTSNVRGFKNVNPTPTPP